MGEWRPVQPVNTGRLAAAQHVIAAAHEQLVADAGNQVSPADPRWAHIYVSRVLAADDDAGRADGRVVRGDEVRWADAVALARAAAGLLDPAHDGQDVTGCGACDLWRAVARVRAAAQQAGIGPVQ